MQWAALPRGGFTGIDWSAPGATEGWDPYLVWADCVRFAGAGAPSTRWLPVAIELHPGVTVPQLVGAAGPAWLRVPPVYTSQAAPAGLRFCTGRARPEFFRALQAGGKLHPLVQRVELGLPVPGTDDATEAAAPAGGGVEPPAARLSGTVFGLIDDSLAVANTCFLHADGTPRTAWLWRQDGHGEGRRPKALGYGQELQAQDISAALERHRHGGLVDEGAVYTALGLSAMGRPWPGGQAPFHTLDLATSHGSHVADLACGPRRATAQIANLPPGFDAPPSFAPADDAASRCPIVAVQLDHDTVKDTSGGSLQVHVLDGLLYILSRCDDQARIAVNISFGALAGPHDGSGLLEQAMDQLVELCGGRLGITLAAGNSYQLRAHANLRVEAGSRSALHWRVQPDDRTPSFLELWIEPGCDSMEIELTPPGASRPLPAVERGESRIWLDPAGRPLCTLLYPRRIASGLHGTCAMLALAPTFAFAGGVALAPSGVWTLGLHNRGSRAAVVDGYIERDDVVIGTRTGARQSWFEDAPQLPWAQQYDLDALVDDPQRATPIRRSGSFNSIATGRHTVSAGGQRVAGERWAAYSPQAPDPDGSRPQRPGVVKVPDGAAPSDENPALPGLLGAGSRSGGATRLAGTSAAAPQLARQLLNAGVTSVPAASS